MLRSATRHHALSALRALDAARRARAVRRQGTSAVGQVVASLQLQQALASDVAVEAMLLEQRIDVRPDHALNPAAFTTSNDLLDQMLDEVGDDEGRFDRLVASLVQDAGRAAESVAITSRHNIWHVRFLTPPSCSRCVVLAGRIYRWSEGFLRHPGDDCVMIPTTVAAGPDYVQDPVELMQQGLVTGLSKADQQAIADGADFSQVVNTRLRSAGLEQAGRVLARGDRLTPEGIYKASGGDRDAAVDLLRENGYVLPSTTSRPQTATAGGAGGRGVPPTPRSPASADQPDDRVERLADEVMAEAQRIEPTATPAVTAAAREAGGDLTRLDSRFKTRASVVEKLLRFGESPSAVRRQRRNFNDALRYTSVYDETSYWSSVQRLIGELETAGYTVSVGRFGLGWRTVGYRGINLTVINPSGVKFEVQAHTTASLAMAEGSHALYEELRRLRPGTPEYVELSDYINSLYDQVRTPPGVPRID